MFWDTTHSDLDSKISRLESQILSSQSRFVGSHDWDSTFNLMKEIKEDFKKVRYPSGTEKDEAWQIFVNLREDAYRIKQEQYEEKSQDHYNEISEYLNDAYHTEFGDTMVNIISGGLLGRIDVDGMKWKGQRLREAGKLLKQYKFEMTREHKADIHERIISIRESHDIWWGQYKEYQEEKQKAWEERQKAREERKVRKQAARERIEQNLQSNREKLSVAKEKLRNAENALERYKQKRDDLQDKIDESSSDRWIEKVEPYLQEFEDKISDIETSIQDKESYIERLESWIDEDKNKLRNWD